jgi:hypothetical protein
MTLRSCPALGSQGKLVKDAVSEVCFAHERSRTLAETGTDWGDTRFARIPKSASAEGACHPASVQRSHAGSGPCI